jgi:thiol-disulfide isomerase/thioredoxin
MGRADELPRYKLQVGQELVYRTTDPPKEHDDGQGGKYTLGYNIEWTLDVIDELADGGWRLVFVQKIVSSYARNGQENKQELAMDGYVDLTPGGRLLENRTLGPMANPSLIFPPLPPDQGSLTSIWSATFSIDDTRREFSAAPMPATGDGKYQFSEAPRTIFDPIYQMETHRDYVFDLARGLVAKLTTTTHQGWPESQRGQKQVQTIALVSSRMLDDVDRDTLRAEMTRYLEAREKVERLTAQATSDFGNAFKLLHEAKTLLDEVRGQLTLPAVQAMADNKLAQHERSTKYTMQDAVKFATLINQPSPVWQATDLDGQSRPLADYRGQVVLLDFWYRGCGWCIRAMPQIKKLAADFDGRKVAVLGINNDDNLDDARFVVEVVGLNYPTLRNGAGDDAISRKYKINGWPTLVLIDPKGIVRHIHFGYSATLRQDLSEKIKELLAEE